MTTMQKIAEIEAEMARTQKNKATAYHLGLLKAKLAKLKQEIINPKAGGGGGKPGEGFDVTKSGDARVGLIGFPSVGKSTLLTKLTGTESAVAAYEFTTLTCIPGTFKYKGCRIQLLDLPGIIEGAKDGKGRGRQVIAVARTCNLILIVLDAAKPMTHKRIIEKELEGFGIRLNEKPPQIIINRKDRGGINITYATTITKLDKRMITNICKEYKIVSADITLREDATVDQLIDTIEGNRKYVPCLTGDHMVLTRTGWRSIKLIVEDEEVASYNVETTAMEWKKVVATQCNDVDSNTELYRMQTAHMDVIATRDHRMLLAQLRTEGLQKRKPFAYTTVDQLLPPHLTYTATRESRHTKFERTTCRAVLTSGSNHQPDHKLVIAGMERVCDWWWENDQQRGFLCFLGFWLGDGHLLYPSNQYATPYVCVSQRKEEGVKWVERLLNEVFTCWWMRAVTNADANGITYRWYIRCPPLFEWLRPFAVGPLGYNPLDAPSVRHYPHFTPDAELAAKESAHRYYRPRGVGTWTEDAMLTAVTTFERCWWCGGAMREEKDDELMLCDGKGCHAAGHLSCSGLTAVPEGEWLCPSCTEAAEERAVSVTAPMVTEVEVVDDGQDVPDVDEVDDGEGGMYKVPYVEAVVEEKDAVRQQVAGAQIRWWNGAQWLVIDGKWFYLKRCLADMAGTFSRLSNQQAIALLEGFCRADGNWDAVQFDAAGHPKGEWRCSNSSFPLIDQLQLIGQLAGANVELRLHSKAGYTTSIDGRTVRLKTDHWALHLKFDKKRHAPIHTALLGRPTVVSSSIDQRGYYQYEDDGKVYDLTIQDNSNFLTQRLSLKRLQSASGEFGVRGQACFVGNCLYVLNKIDSITVEELELISRVPHYVPIAAASEWNFDDLLEQVWSYLNMKRVYTKPKGQIPDYDSPVVVPADRSTVEEFCLRIHRSLLQQFKYALVWGSSVKHAPQIVGKEHVLQDEDVVQIVKKV